MFDVLQVGGWGYVSQDKQFPTCWHSKRRVWGREMFSLDWLWEPSVFPVFTVPVTGVTFGYTWQYLLLLFLVLKLYAYHWCGYLTPQRC